MGSLVFILLILFSVSLLFLYECTNILQNISVARFMETALVITQLTFTCSNSTIETLEKDVKFVQS